jgi:hypothetical protein
MSFPNGLLALALGKIVSVPPPTPLPHPPAAVEHAPPDTKSLVPASPIFAFSRLAVGRGAQPQIAASARGSSPGRFTAAASLIAAKPQPKNGARFAPVQYPQSPHRNGAPKFRRFPPTLENSALARLSQLTPQKNLRAVRRFWSLVIHGHFHSPERPFAARSADLKRKTVGNRKWTAPMGPFLDLPAAEVNLHLLEMPFDHGVSQSSNRSPGMFR